MSRHADPKAKIALLAAAEAVFAEKGMERSKVEDITHRAGLSKGAFYLHFQSKDEAFRQVAETFLARYSQTFVRPEHVSDSHGMGPHDYLDGSAAHEEEMYEFLWQNRAIVQMLQPCHGDYQYLLEAFRENITGTCCAWVRHLKKCGLYRPEVDEDFATLMIFGAYNELALRVVSAPKKPPIAAWLDAARDTFARAYGTRTLIHALEQARVSGSGRRALSATGE